MFIIDKTDIWMVEEEPIKNFDFGKLEKMVDED